MSLFVSETVLLFNPDERRNFTEHFKNRRAVITVEASEHGMVAHVIAYPVLLARATKHLIEMRLAP